MMENNARAHVIISGRVQGVFFRMETQRAAKRFAISGWVKNRWDGAVEALFEGEKKQVEIIIEWCRKGPPHALVKDLVVSWGVYSGEFNDFEIRY